MEEEGGLLAGWQLLEDEGYEGCVLMMAHFEDWMEEVHVAVGVGGLLGDLSELFGTLRCLLLFLRLPFLQILVDESSWQVVTLCEFIIIVDFHLQPILLNKHLQIFVLLHVLLCLLPLALQATHVLDVL